MSLLEAVEKPTALGIPALLGGSKSSCTRCTLRFLAPSRLGLPALATVFHQLLMLSCTLDQVEQLRYFSIMITTASIENALRDMADLPASVQAWNVEVGADATGDEAVWVWVTLRDEDLNRQTRERFRDLVRNAIRQRTSDSPPWVYVRFRGASQRWRHSEPSSWSATPSPSARCSGTTSPSADQSSSLCSFNDRCIVETHSATASSHQPVKTSLTSSLQKTCHAKDQVRGNIYGSFSA